MSAAGRDRLCYELKPNVQWVVETKLTPWLVLLICALDVLWIWKNKPIQWLDIGFDSFRLPGLGLGDIERKAIYFNQGLLAQLLTIVGWMGAINKTYGLPPLSLSEQLASDKPAEALLPGDNMKADQLRRWMVCSIKHDTTYF